MVTMMMKTATNIMQKLCAYLIFVFCCDAFGPMNGNSIALPSNSHTNSHHHHHHHHQQHQHQHQHPHNNRHLHLNSYHSDESRLQLQLLQHNNSDVPAKKRINFYYSSLSRAQSTNPYNRINENNKSHNIADEPDVYKTIHPHTIANQTLQSQSNDEPASNSNAKFRQRNTATMSTKTSLNSLKLTLIQTNGNYPNFNRWPIVTPQATNTEQSYPFHGNDYGFKWKPANDQFVPSFKPTFESIPNPIGKTTTPTPTPNDFDMRDHRFHSKLHRGRHVCVEYKSIISSNVQQYRKNAHSLLCRNSSHCDSARLLFYDNPNMIPSRRTSNHATYTCCAGWSKISKNSHGCTKPICKMLCKNNGKCIKPEQCSCPIGYTGTHCEFDIDECITDKPCDQMCHNTDGSFYCTCRLGFELHSDRQSCRKIDSVFGSNDTGTAFEARDLENDLDNDDLVSRMHNMEKLMITEKERNLETNKLIHRTLITFNNIKQRLETLESRQIELNLLRDRLKSYEIQVHKLEYTIDLLYKCHRNPLIYCPQLP